MRLALLRLAGALSLLAAAWHAAAAAEHFAEWWGYGVFFVVASALQALFGLVLLALPRTPAWPQAAWLRFLRRLLAAGIALNLATLALYVVTRTVGIPLLGPAAGEVEPVGALDAASKATELLLLATLALGWPRAKPAAAAQP